MKSRARVLVHGRVQGVFYRAHVEEEARRRGVTGWVRNLSDGRVEAVFEGERGSVDEMIKFCRNGPPEAMVMGVDVSWEGYRGEFPTFEVRYRG